MKSIYLFFILIVVSLNTAQAQDQKGPESIEPPVYRMDVWRGSIWLPHDINLLTIKPRKAEDRFYYLWFYEHTLLDAVEKGCAVYHGHKPTILTFSADGSRAEIDVLGEQPMKLECESAEDGVDLRLTVTNTTDYAWPEVAAILPCMSPGNSHPNSPSPPISELFRDDDRTRTYHVGPDGLALLPEVYSPLYFNHRLRPRIDQFLEARESEPLKLTTSGFPNSEGHKWTISPKEAYAGFLVRESVDGKWVAGIGWEDFISVSAHYPLRCMHNSVRIGPLKPGETKTVCGKIYLFEGNKEECYKRFRNDYNLSKSAMPKGDPSLNNMNFEEKESNEQNN